MRTTRMLAAAVLVAGAALAPSIASADDDDETLVEGEAEPPAEEDATTGWFRVDTDSLETQFWLGATHKVNGFSIASDIYVVGSFAEFDIGPAFSFGNLSLTPMVGIGFDFSTTDVSTLVAPQLFTIYSGSKIYFESWIQFFFNDLFTDGAEDLAYTRNYVLYKLNDTIAIGPQVELTYRLNENDDPMEGFDSELVSLPVGGHIDLGYGKGNTLGLFLGYETQDIPEDADGIVGRFTFVRIW